ncbi:hypothetical protein [Nocardioides alcanivorans]|uniref:hypothetical protein n=1 Tax=Nocardioides alcanivorans TaxID=2897352 RepID=UPI001F483669|nr:hypothetical protein [Nocardioides alcanivorans]
MADTCGDVTHRAYELALGAGLGFWERSTQVRTSLGSEQARSGLLATLGGARRRKAAHLMLHTFDGGLVVERLRGGVRGAPYGAVTAVLLDIDSPRGDASIGLRLTFDDGNQLVVVEQPQGDAQPLVEVAGRCRTSSRSRVSRQEAAAALRDPGWI